MEYKEINKKFYDKHAVEFEKNTKGDLQKYILNDIYLSLKKLSGEKILDLGCGPGRDSVYFKEKGFNPVCVDLSKEMIDLCKEKDLQAYQIDLENISFKNNSFDGIWAYASLLHILKKNLPCVLLEIKRILKTNGIFYLGMKKGKFEGLIKDERYSDDKRFFTLYQNEELKKIISKYFKIIHTLEFKIMGSTYLNYLCKKVKSSKE
tara:strand:+ start:25609 stop:26226 length:618 start_codon:yes stop_codon:yes gene_type:complete